MKKLNAKYKWLIGFLISIYVISYFTISRLSYAEVKHNWRINDSFLYVPGATKKLEESPDGILYKLHCCLYCVYYPIYVFDRTFGGPEAMRNLPLFKLGGSK